MINYGDYVSKENFEKIYAESQRKSEVVERAIFDTRCVDYTNKSLDLRNNPWFFNKNYSYTDRPRDGKYNFPRSLKEQAAATEALERSNDN
jgi:hypothetical protein